MLWVGLGWVGWVALLRANESYLSDFSWMEIFGWKLGWSVGDFPWFFPSQKEVVKK